MIVTDAPESVKREFLDRLKKLYGFTQHREGIHLSDLTRCITKSFFHKDSPKIEPGDIETLYWVVGIGLENALNYNETSPQGQTKDGVIGTPDTFIYSTKDWGEVKTTRMSFDTDGNPKHGWPDEWVKRIKGYCFLMGCHTYTLIVIPIIRASLVTKVFTFDTSEIVSHWLDYIIPRRDVLKQALAEGIPPKPFAFNESWECKHCEYITLCNAFSIGNKYIEPPEGYGVDVESIPI